MYAIRKVRQFCSRFNDSLLASLNLVLLEGLVHRQNSYPLACKYALSFCSSFVQKYIGRGPVEFIPSDETKPRILFLVRISHNLYCGYHKYSVATHMSLISC